MAGTIATPQRDDWGTPDWVVTAVEMVLTRIDLDPCGNPARYLPRVHKTICLPDDGLMGPWVGLRVYANPPYGKPLDAWMDKFEGEAFLHGAHVIALLPVVTSRKAWHRSAKEAAAICFLSGRVRFDGAPSSAAFSSCLMLWSRDTIIIQRFVKVMKNHGHVMITAV
jgi:hypothetical protein